jgi:hypothetical protein
MRLTIIAAAACLLAASSLAQEAAPDRQEAAAAPDETSAEAEEELSELERLSRSSTDPFENVTTANERIPVSVTLRALDKITARYTDIEIEMHQIARFGSLEIQPRYCDKRPPEEFPETTAFLEIFDTEEQNNRQSDLKSAALNAPPPPAQDVSDMDPSAPEALGVAPLSDAAVANERLDPRPDREGGKSMTRAPSRADREGGQPLTRAPSRAEPAPEVLTGPQAEGENIFRGWMFASSPALNGLEHPVYDVWVIDCTTRAADN